MDKTNQRINPGSNGVNCLACLPDLDQSLARTPELAAAWSNLPRRALRKGQQLVRIGQSVNQLWRVERGLLRMYYLSPQGVERNRSFHAERHWVGAGAPPLEADSPYVIEALEDSTLVELRYVLLQELMAQHPELRATLQDALGSIFEQQNQRVSELLTLDAAARYQAFLEFHGEMAQRLPLHHVASYLGITNVALSRIRRRRK